MVDKVHSGIGVVTESNFLVHKHLVGEGIEDFGLLVLRRVGFGGVCGAAEGVVFLGTIVTCLDCACEGGGGEIEEREEGCEIHCVEIWEMRMGGGWKLWMRGRLIWMEQGSELYAWPSDRRDAGFFMTLSSLLIMSCSAMTKAVFTA